jgi:hypothetical protein
LIEVPRPWCIRINRWYAALADSANAVGRAALRNALRSDLVIVDVFVEFELCDRGKTPSFAEGAIDATDATAPHRVRDAFRFLLAPRDLDPDDPRTLPGPRFPAFSSATPEQRVIELKQHILAGWNGTLARPGERARPHPGEPQLAWAREQPLTLSPGVVFLARLRIPAVAGAGDAAPTPNFAAMNATHVDNLSRAFVFPSDALARALGLVPEV